MICNFLAGENELMSEDKNNKEQNKGVKVTSDNNNAGAAIAGANANVPAGEPDLDAGDDILELIRRRKAAESGKSRPEAEAADKAVSEGDADDLFNIEGLDHELPAPPRKGADTRVVDRTAISREQQKSGTDLRRTITADTANNDAALGETFEDLKRTLEVDAGTFAYSGDPSERSKKKPVKADTSDAAAKPAKKESADAAAKPAKTESADAAAKSAKSESADAAAKSAKSESAGTTKKSADASGEKKTDQKKDEKEKKSEIDIADRTDIDIKDYFFPEPEEKPQENAGKNKDDKTSEGDTSGTSGDQAEKAGSSAAADKKKEGSSEGGKSSEKSGKSSSDKKASDKKTAKKKKGTEADKEAASDALLEELVSEEIGGEGGKGGDDKRYGFKPYTRELRSMELAAAAQAEAEKESNSLTGKFKRMATKRKKSASGAGTKSKSSAGSKSSSGKSSSAKSSSGKGSKSKSGSGQSRATKNSKTLTNYKVPKNTAAYKLTDYQKYAKNNKGKSKSKKRSRKPKKKWVGFVKAFISTIIVAVIIGCIAGAGYTAYVVSHAPVIHPKNIYDTLDVSSHIYDDQENLVDEIYFSENRELATFDQLPENLTNAFIAVEDKTFWTHKGFNFRRIIGAILERFHGGRISGTSTITQQLARNVFLPEEKSVRSIKRKIIEMYYAYEIEQELSKEEIITAYLNTIYLGYGCYGVDTAAKMYFDTDVEGLTLEQCAALAALPQAPGSYALLTTEPTEASVEYGNGIYINDASADRRNMILNLMCQQGMITQEEKEAATRPLEEFIKPGSRNSVSSTSAFKDYLIETIKRDLMNEYGIEEEQAVKIIYTKGLNIYTTLNSQAQETITKQFKDKDNFPSVEKGDGEVEAAMVITEVGTGEIKAMVGTRNATSQMAFNRATNPRQPGSSIKPLAVYAPALERSLEYQKDGKTFKFKDTGYDRQGTRLWGDYLTVSSIVVDEPMKVEGRTWPLNVTRSYSGTQTFRTAIQKSINTCSVKILSQIGLDYSMDTVKRFGITSVVDDTSLPVNDYNLAALGLGAMTYGISPLEMSAAYAVFPNGGVRNTTICYTKVEDSGGRTLLESKSETVKVLDPGVAWIMTDVLQSVVSRGIAGDAEVDGIEVGGKTGTTDDRYDIWFNGFTPNISVALWIGTDKNVAMDSSSEKAAALWSKVVSRVDIADEGEYPDMPDNVFRAWNGEYYTTGTAPEKPPEPDPEEVKKKEEEKKKADAAKKAAEDAKKGAASGQTPAPAPAPAPSAETTPAG